MRILPLSQQDGPSLPAPCRSANQRFPTFLGWVGWDGSDTWGGEGEGRGPGAGVDAGAAAADPPARGAPHAVPGRGVVRLRRRLPRRQRPSPEAPALPTATPGSRPVKGQSATGHSRTANLSVPSARVRFFCRLASRSYSSRRFFTVVFWGIAAVSGAHPIIAAITTVE